MMQSKAIALSTTRDLIKGDSRINPRVPDGLQPRCTGSQLIANAPAGAPLSLLKLDELIDTVDQPQYLLMSKAMRRRISAIIRNTTVGGFISYGVDALGRQVTKYNDIPIMIVDYDNNNDQILPFTEASPDASAVTSTSIYCISFADGMVTGLQGAVAGQYGISARDLNEMEGLPHLLTRVEWYMALAVRHGRSVARLHGITDAPVAV